MKIKILGTGCYNCRLLAEKTERAARELGLDYEIEKVEDFEEILSFGVMATPALVIDGEVRLSGFVPPLARIREILSGG